MSVWRVCVMDVCMLRIVDSCIIYVICMLGIEFALDYVDEAAITEQYGNKVGLAALEWCDVFDPEYRRTTWIADEE